MSKERLKEILKMLQQSLDHVDEEIYSLNQTLVERETKRLKIIDAILDIEEMLEK